MAKRKFRFRKGSIKSILLAVLVGILIIASISGIVALFSRETRSVSSLSFAVGALDDDGLYTSDKTSIYTKDWIACQGLCIEPDFEAKGSFQVFYYDERKQFLSSTELIDAQGGVYKKGSDHVLAKYCRIVIKPEPIDENGEYLADFEIHWYETAKYAGQYTITVNRDQNLKLKNLFCADPDMVNRVYTLTAGGMFTQGTETCSFEKRGFGGTARIPISEYTQLAIFCDADATVGMYEFFILSESGEVLSVGTNAGGTETLISDLPENAAYFICNYKLGQEFTITPLA